MTEWWHRHKNLIGYVFIVLVAVAAIELHRYQRNKIIERNARIDSTNGQILARNQRIVVARLILLSREHGVSTKDLEPLLTLVPVDWCQTKTT